MNSKAYTTWTRLCAGIILLSALVLDRSHSRFWRFVIEAVASAAAASGMAAYFRFHLVKPADVLDPHPKPESLGSFAEVIKTDIWPNALVKSEGGTIYSAIDHGDPYKFYVGKLLGSKGAPFKSSLEQWSFEISHSPTDNARDAIRVFAIFMQHSESYEMEFKHSGPLIIRLAPPKKHAKSLSGWWQADRNYQGGLWRNRFVDNSGVLRVPTYTPKSLQLRIGRDFKPNRIFA